MAKAAKACTIADGEHPDRRGVDERCHRGDLFGDEQRVVEGRQEHGADLERPADGR
jgi:hypothetical protein